MHFVSDLHLHSKYSRAVSRDMVLPTMAQFAKLKGIDILTTGDWTHPLWLREIRNQLEEASDGLFRLKNPTQNSKTEKEPLFLLSVEVSSIYSQGGKLRRIHNLILSPSFETVDKINKALVGRGSNLLSDGRPIMGISAKDLLELVLSQDKNALLIPCHAWTPWFSLYGSNSGFDSIEECFGQSAQYIYGVETGLSSDPEMNWHIEELQSRSLLSFSDAHSPMKMGREATVFELEKPSFENIKKAIMRQSPNKIVYTIEFYPEEGKYHYTGHRNCKVVQTPDETKEKGTICPVCHRKLTVGVMHRVEELSSPKLSSLVARFVSNNNGVKWLRDPEGIHPPFVKLVPLIEIAAESLSSTVSSMRVKTLFDSLCQAFGSEINILLKTPVEEIEKAFGADIAGNILRVRKGDIFVEPGFDGEYGKVKIKESEKENKEEAKSQIQSSGRSQMSLDF